MQLLPLADGQSQTLATAAPTAATRRRRTWYAVLILLFFAATIPETLTTTSTSVAKIVTQPWNLFFIMAFYGLADLLIREALIRRHLGWVSLIMLGIAFAFINEGVVAGTWYPGKYEGGAYIGQVDFVVAAGLTVFHIFISVITPIALMDALFPSLVGVPLLRRRRGVVLSAIIFLLVTCLFIFLPTYRIYRLVVFVVALTLALVALRLPAAPPRIVMFDAAPGLWKLRRAGFLGCIALFGAILVMPWLIQQLAGPRIVVAQAITVALLALFAALLLRIGHRWTAHAGWSLRHTLALITGAMTPPILFMLLPPFWPTLEPLATIPFFALLLIVNARLRRHKPVAVNAPIAPIAPVAVNVS